VRLKEVVNNRFKIFLDLDGVMADFNRGRREILKLPDGAPSEEIFAALAGDKGKDFFLKLPKTRDADQLWKFLKGNDLQILTAIPTTNREEAAKNKVQWVKRNLSKNVKTITTTRRNKKKYAGPDNILIDDHKKNIEEWEGAGGIGIFHTSASKTIKELKRLGFK